MQVRWVSLKLETAAGPLALRLLF